MTRNASKEEGGRAFLRPPMGNYAVYAREYLSAARSYVVKAWTQGSSNWLKREVALTLLADPELRLRVCHLEEILRWRQLASRQQGTGSTLGISQTGINTTNGRDLPALQLQTALADPTFSALFVLDSSVNDPDWGMQVLWLNMPQLQKELGLPPPPPPPFPPPAESPTSPPLPTAAAAAEPPRIVSSPPGADGSPQALAPEPALLTAFELAFPNHPTDDDEYLAIAACYCLATRRDPKSLLPPYSLHVNDLTAHLRTFAVLDARLAAALQRLAAAAAPPRNASGGGAAAAAAAAPLQALAARVSELLAAPRARGVFRQSESLSRRGERVASLAVELLMRYTGGGAAAAAVARNGNWSARPSYSGVTVPYETWQRVGVAAAAAAAAVNGSAAGTVAAAGDGLPSFLFEYEAPAGDWSGRDASSPSALVTQRDQYGDAAGGSPVARSSPSAASGANGLRIISSASQHQPAPIEPSSPAPPPPPPPPLPPHLQPSAGTSLHHAWSDGSRILPSTIAAALPPPPPPLLQSMASEPVPLRANDPERGVIRPPPPASDGGGGGGAAAATVPRGINDLYGRSSMGQSPPGAGWPCNKAPGAAEGASPSNSLSSSMRYPPFNAAAQDMARQSLAAAAGGAQSLSTMTTAAAAAAVLAASPGGPAVELQVPPEIADVWSNAGVAGGGAERRGSVTASLNGGLPGLLGDSSLTGIFAMSPPQETSNIWDRVAAASQQPAANLGRDGVNGLNGGNGLNDLNSVNGINGVNGVKGTDLGPLGALAGLGLGYGTAHGGVAGGGATLHVGSAPSVFVPPFLNGGAAAAAAAAPPPQPLGDPSVGRGLGGSGAFLMDYASWNSSSAELSSSMGGRSAPSDAAAAPSMQSWLLAFGARANGGCGGGGAGGAGGGSPAAPAGRQPAVAANGGGVGAMNGAAAPGAAALAARTATGPSPSVSEQSEEAASLVGGLDLDPMALSLEALIGFDPLSQIDPTQGTLARRATISGPTGGATSVAVAAAVGKGLIAAAAAPRIDAVAVAACGSTAPSKSFTSVSVSSANSNASGGGAAAAAATAADGSSRHSSLDSCDVLNGTAGVTNNAAVLTGWSAMAARGPAAGLQMAAAAAAAAANAGRASGTQLQPAGLLTQPGTATAMMTAQGLAATMAAMGVAAAAAAGGGGGAALAVPRQASLGRATAATTAAVLSPGGLMVAPGMAHPTAAAASIVGRDLFGGKSNHSKLSPRVREEIIQLIHTVPGLKAEDFDDGVVHQLTLKKSEEEAVGALRTLAAENLSGIQHMAAYINHIIKNYHLAGGPAGSGVPGAIAPSLPSATVRANSTPVSSKAILQKLPYRVYRRLEELINKCSFMEWKHFDAGVVKVMAQLAEIGEEDVFEELELLKSTDLSNVEYMPAYLNKRLNNRLWSRRKMLTSAATAAAMGAGVP